MTPVAWPGRRSRRPQSAATLIRSASSVDSLRVGLSFINGEKLPKILAVTAPVSRDGKISLACGLAVTIARSGRNVCLVEADLDDPSLDQSLPVPPGSPALCDALIGRCSVDDVLHKWPEAGLTVVPAGNLPGNAATSRAMARMEQVLRDLSSRFDVVVVNTPPVLPVTDALGIARIADATVVVVRYGKTKKGSLAECFAMLRLAGAEQLSTVMVGMSKRAWRKYSRRVADARQRLPEQPPVGTAEPSAQGLTPSAGASAAASPTENRETASSEGSVHEPGSSGAQGAIDLQRYGPSYDRGAEVRQLPQPTNRLGRHTGGRAAAAPR